MNDRANAVSDTVSLSSAGLDVLGGIHVLGCGLNQLTWAASGVAGNHVLDTTSRPRTKTIDGKEYQVGENVEFAPKTGSITTIHTFESSADYHSKSSLNANASGSYGAFSAGFEATFNQSVDILDESYAATYSHAEQLWTVEAKNLEANLCAGFVSDVAKLPEALADDYSNIDVFIDFFTRYGVDVVNQVTAGGNLTYSILVEKNTTQKKTDLSASVTAGYGTFVSKASGSISEETKKQAQTQRVTIKTVGGTTEIKFNLNQPRNHYDDFENWRKSLPHAPRIVDIALTPITRFVPEKYQKQKAALEKARKWYVHYEATIVADWQTSHIDVVNASVQSGHAGLRANGLGKPALHIVVVGKDRRPRLDTRLEAPERREGDAQFAAFWQRAREVLGGAKEGHEIVLLATERWPRDSRYYPSAEVYTQLRQLGASQRTLQRWQKLVQNMQPCSIAGITYVLAGRGLSSQVTDFVAAGFGTPGQNTIRPTVNVCARFVQDSAKETRMLITSSTEETNTKLHIIQNTDGNRLALACGTTDKTRIETVDGNPKHGGKDAYLGQFWYFLPWSRPYDVIKHPHILINFETGACLQGKLDQTECRMLPFGDDDHPQQDDVIWDVRDNPTNFLMVYCYHDALNLTQVDKTASVRPWLKNYMRWTIRDFDNFSW